MGNILNSIKDTFTNETFVISGSMTISEMSRKFLKTFGCSLRIYKGTQLADGRMTINALNKRVTSKIKKDASELKIKANEKVGDVEYKFKEHFGLKVQVADKHNSKLLPNVVTLGEGSRL